MKLNALIAAVAVSVLAAPAMAAKPDAYFKADPVTLESGKVVEASRVVCTDEREITLLEIGRKWCTGESADAICNGSKFKVAKKACR